MGLTFSDLIELGPLHPCQSTKLRPKAIPSTKAIPTGRRTTNSLNRPTQHELPRFAANHHEMKLPRLHRPSLFGSTHLVFSPYMGRDRSPLPPR